MYNQTILLLFFCLYFFACASPVDVVNKPVIRFDSFSPSDTVELSQTLDINLKLLDMDANTTTINLKMIYPDLEDTSDVSSQQLPVTSTLSLNDVEVIVGFINAGVDNQEGRRLSLINSTTNNLRNYNLQFMIWAEDAASNLSDSIVTPTIFIKTQ